jgi:hypothetical protein
MRTVRRKAFHREPTCAMPRRCCPRAPSSPTRKASAPAAPRHSPTSFRYKLLLERGGTWCDTDMVCVRPLDFLGRMPYCLRLAEHAAPPGRDLGRAPQRLHDEGPRRERARAALPREAESLSADPGEAQVGTTGPDLVTRMAYPLGLQGYALPPEVACPVDFFRLEALLVEPAALSCQRACGPLLERDVALPQASTRTPRTRRTASTSS